GEKPWRFVGTGSSCEGGKPGGLSSSKRGKLLEIGFDNMTNLLENQVADCILNKQSQPCTADKKVMCRPAAAAATQ
ncbi:hypothetical protein HAX54_031818, partial [Datura stramonium]|nr:hypothetical protein [Datura stramonium]